MPNSEPDPTPWHLYEEWEESDLAESEDPDPDKFEDAFRSGPQVEDQFLSALNADVVVQDVSIWQALQIWRKNNRRN